ncbi:hypothetical protein GWK47_035438 [Chionoecetes opilio]|uniref:Uncharacterized protein n=1 Tax=Chionoecetes opilio TaxID=41210 RepID=A0A8J5CNL2_CHIOP|nr:hypothetical protein GWK47_035438 [Chionoecetes opilio]
MSAHCSTSARQRTRPPQSPRRLIRTRRSGAASGKVMARHMWTSPRSSSALCSSTEATVGRGRSGPSSAPCSSGWGRKNRLAAPTPPSTQWEQRSLESFATTTLSALVPPSGRSRFPQRPDPAEWSGEDGLHHGLVGGPVTYGWLNDFAERASPSSARSAAPSRRRGHTATAPSAQGSGPPPGVLPVREIGITLGCALQHSVAHEVCLLSTRVLLPSRINIQGGHMKRMFCDLFISYMGRDRLVYYKAGRDHRWRLSNAIGVTIKIPFKHNPSWVFMLRVFPPGHFVATSSQKYFLIGLFPTMFTFLWTFFPYSPKKGLILKEPGVRACRYETLHPPGK